MTATYLGVKGTHGVQEILPNTYPIGAESPCPACPLDFDYRTSGGNSTRESGQLQLRRRLRSGFTASLLYTYSKSIDNDAALGGQGHVAAASQGQAATDLVQAASPSLAIAQNWLNLRAERALSTFDQRNLLNVQAQYTTGQGVSGGTLMTGWRGRLLQGVDGGDANKLRDWNAGDADLSGCGSRHRLHRDHSAQPHRRVHIRRNHRPSISIPRRTQRPPWASGELQAAIPSPAPVSSASTARLSAPSVPPQSSTSSLASTRPTCSITLSSADGSRPSTARSLACPLLQTQCAACKPRYG